MKISCWLTLNYVRVVDNRNARFQFKQPARNILEGTSKAAGKLEIGVTNVGLKYHRVCFNCESKMHIVPRRSKGACYSCESTAHLRSACPEHTQKNGSSCAMERQQKEGQGESSKEVMLLEPAYHVNLSMQFSNKIISVSAVIDSGSPIFVIKYYMVEVKDRLIFNNTLSYLFFF